MFLGHTPTSENKGLGLGFVLVSTLCMTWYWDQNLVGKSGNVARPVTYAHAHL